MKGLAKLEWRDLADSQRCQMRGEVQLAGEVRFVFADGLRIERGTDGRSKLLDKFGKFEVA